MSNKSPRSKAPSPGYGGRQVAAFAVHALTASGAFWAFLAILAAIAGKWTEMFVWLAIAILIDAVDGSFAHRLDIARLLPRWSGEVLDLIIDYLTYVFVPTLALVTGSILPAALALPAAAAILISGAIYFSDRHMKTEDAYFRGFPALWNIVAFYLFLLRPDSSIALVIVAMFLALTFMPFFFVHPLRVKRFAAVNVTLVTLWAALGFLALYYDLSPPPLVTAGLAMIAIYFIISGLARPIRRTS